MKIAIINSYYPPDGSATGYYANRIATALQVQDAIKSIEVLTTEGAYQKVKSEEAPTGNVHRVGSLYKGKSRLRRLLSSLWVSLRLILAARRSGADFFIVLSDPPFNNFWSALLLPSSKVAFWTMDLYPQAFAAAGLTSERSMIYKVYSWVIHRWRPALFITLGEQQAAHIRDWTQHSKIVHLPIGLREQSDQKGVAPSWYNPDYTYIGYVGNLGEAHNADFIKRIADNLQSNQRLIYSGYGSKDAETRQYLSDLTGIILLDGIPHDQMGYIDVQIVSLLPEWTHICVPSKALSALQHGSAILYDGSEDSDTWQYVKQAAISFGEMDTLSSRKLNELQEASRHIVRTLEARWDVGVRQIIDYILKQEE